MQETVSFVTSQVVPPLATRDPHTPISSEKLFGLAGDVSGCIFEPSVVVHAGGRSSCANAVAAHAVVTRIEKIDGIFFVVSNNYMYSCIRQRMGWEEER